MPITFKQFLENDSDRSYRISSIEQYARIAGSYEKGTLNTTNISKRYRVLVKAAIKKYAQYRAKVFNVKDVKEIVERNGKINQYATKELLFINEIPKAIDKPKLPEEPLSNEEWKKMKDEVKKLDPVYKAIIGIMLETGLRVSDVGRTRREWIVQAQETGKLLLDPKGGHYQTYPWNIISEYLEPLLKEKTGWTIIYDLVCEGSQHSQYYAIWRKVRELGEKIGIDKTRMHPHLLRKTVAMQLWKATGDIGKVQKFLNHQNITTTMEYLKYNDPEIMKDTYSVLEKNRNKK